MKFDEITAEILRGAMEIYMAAAYDTKHPPLTVRNRVTLLTEHAGDDLADVLSHDLFERVVSEEDENVVECYAVRLGNEKYPHMKLALRRRTGGDYHLVVEPHDQHFEVESTDPDAPKAQELREHNRRLKERIESLWREADLPVAEEA